MFHSVYWSCAKKYLHYLCDIQLLLKIMTHTETYSEPCQTSKMKAFAIKANSWKRIWRIRICHARNKLVLHILYFTKENYCNSKQVFKSYWDSITLTVSYFVFNFYYCLLLQLPLLAFRKPCSWKVLSSNASLMDR